MHLILFTDSYPFDSASEQTFIGRELPHLLSHFHQVTLVPKSNEGRRLQVPFGAEVDESFADMNKKNAGVLNLLRRALSSPWFLQEIRSNPSLLFSPAKLVKLILFLGRVELAHLWISKWMESNDRVVDHCLFYSYWFDHIPTGLTAIKEKYPDCKIVSRAHGYDIYEDIYFPYYWPCRRQTLAILDRVFTASDNGRDYFRQRFPEFNDLFETAHLGVDDLGFSSYPSTNGVLRIISCANLWPLKRIDLLCEGIAYAARKRPEQKIEWHHFGEGKKLQALQKTVVTLFPPNATGNLPGYLSNKDIMKHYKEKPVDVFVNLSTTEGGAPVSIQEAISCGIPVIATNVGGNPEIVSDRNGLLLNSDPTPQEVAEALLWFCDNPKLALKKRAESRKVWQENYNADVNFRNFAERLKRIAES